MRSPFYLSLLIFTLLLFSCQKDQEMAPDTSTYFVETDLLPKEVILTPAQTFEMRMQWAAFLAAKVLRRDEESRIEILHLLANSNSIDLDVLLNGTSAPAFREKFIHYLENYIGRTFNPEPEKDKPGRPIAGPCRAGLAAIEVNNKAAFYINYMTNQNCTELYFPQLPNQINSRTLVSTAHPLTEASSNTAYERYTGITVVDGIETVTNKIIVKPEHLNLPDYHIIVARPFRETENYACTYEEYGEIEFTDFLND